MTLEARVRLPHKELLLPSECGFLFTGQGSQFLYMGRAIAEVSPAAQEVFNRAQEVMGYYPWELTGIQIDENRYAQPAIVAADIAALAAFKERFPAFVEQPSADSFGHSVGIIAAMCAADMMNLQTALTLAQKRGEYMDETAPGRMAVLLKKEPLNQEQIALICAQHNLAIAAVNSPTQIAISGADKDMTDEVFQAIKEATSARIRLLDGITIAGHHPTIMLPARAKLASYLKSGELQFNKPRFPIRSCHDGQELNTADEVLEALLISMTSPVQCALAIENMWKSGVNTFIECGAKLILAAFVGPNTDNIRQGFFWNKYDPNTA